MSPPERPADRVQLNREEVIPALEARERFLDAILGSLEAFLAVDEDWRLTFVNKAAAERAGAAAGDLLGMELWAVMPDLLDGAARGSLERAMAERESAEFEAETTSARAYHARAYPLADGGLAVYIQDVSERRRRELEREQLSAALALSEAELRRRLRGLAVRDVDHRDAVRQDPAGQPRPRGAHRLLARRPHRTDQSRSRDHRPRIPRRGGRAGSRPRE